MNDLAFAGHVDEADLLRHMDGALLDTDATVIETHLATCASCAERLRLLGDWSRDLSEVLTATDVAVVLPEKPVFRGGRSRVWQIAASIALIISLGAVVSPVRAWFLHAGRRAWSALTHAPSPPALRPPASSMVTMRPVGTSFSINVPGSGIESRLAIEVVDGDSVWATATGTTGAARILVLPDGLQLGSGGEYLVRIPARLSRITVSRDRQTVRTLNPSRTGERWEFAFQRDTNGR